MFSLLNWLYHFGGALQNNMCGYIYKLKDDSDQDLVDLDQELTRSGSHRSPGRGIPNRSITAMTIVMTGSA